MREIREAEMGIFQFRENLPPGHSQAVADIERSGGKTRKYPKKIPLRKGKAEHKILPGKTPVLTKPYADETTFVRIACTLIRPDTIPSKRDLEFRHFSALTLWKSYDKIYD